MPIPIAANLKARYPEFSDIADARVDAVIAEAAREVDETWIAGDVAPAILALAAHLMVMDGDLPDVNLTGGPTAPGPVSQMKVGDVSVAFAAGRAAASSGGGSRTGWDHYTATQYGRRFVELRARSQPGILLV